MENPLGLEYTDEYGREYWAWNCPLQMWATYKDEEDEKTPVTGWRILNYMPRKEACCSMDEEITPEEMPAYCRNAAKVLRNLADRFDMVADGKVTNIYYPDEQKDTP